MSASELIERYLNESMNLSADVKRYFQKHGAEATGVELYSALKDIVQTEDLEDHQETAFVDAIRGLSRIKGRF
jgi:hypothetical protein